MILGAIYLLAILLLMLVVVGGIVVVVVIRNRSRNNRGGEKRSPAWGWAARRGVTLTERSVPFVDTYLRNAKALRLVCAAGALLLAAAWSHGTGIDLGGIGFAWVLGGYLVGSVWAELSLARVPASPTREASLVVRDPRTYTVPWLASAQVVLPLVLVALAGYAYLVDPVPEPSTTHGLDWWTTDNVRTQAVAAGLLALISLIVTTLAQRRIVRRPQPRTEPDLVAADEAMRTSAVHILGITHLVLCLLLATAGLLHIAHTRSDRANGPVAVLIVAVVAAAVMLWCLRTQVPGRFGGPVPPPPFPPEAAAAVDLTQPEDVSWTAPRRPDLAALATIAVLALGLWGLRWLGPVNPDIDAIGSAADPMGPSRLPEGSASAPYTVTVTNRSLLPVEIHDFFNSGPEGHYPGLSAEVADITVAHQSGGLSNDVRGPAYLTRLQGGETAVFTLTLTAPECPTTAAVPGTVTGPDTVSLVTATGRWTTAPIRSLWPPALQCVIKLPTGPQPDDPEGATRGIEQAFAQAYGRRDGERRTPVLIDRAEGLDLLGDEAARGSFADIVVNTRAEVTQVGFDRPDHAAVLYELRGPGIRTPRRGEAVLVDGAWMVSRETVCADLSLVYIRCP